MSLIFTRHNSQQGFALVAALFVLLGLAVLGGYLLTMATVQSRASTLSLNGARGYHAARSGIEWGIARAAGGNCSASSSFSVPGSGFDVAVTCRSEAISEGSQAYHVYSLSSLASSRSYGSENYVSRKLEVKVTGP